MDGLLEHVQTKRIVKKSHIQEVETPKPIHNYKDPKDILKALKSQPDLQTFRSVIEALHKFHSSFDVRIPSPQSTPILQALVSDVLPNYWKQLSGDGSLQTVFDKTIDCLRSLPALGVIVFRLKAILNEIAAAGQKSFVSSQAASLVELSERICEGNLFIVNIWRNLNQQNDNKTRKLLTWREFVSLLASGKLLSTVSEVQSVLQKSPDYGHNSWIADGTEYAKWLAKNIEYLDREAGDKVDASKDCALLLSKSLSLGYTDIIVKELFQSYVSSNDTQLARMNNLLVQLKPFEVRALVISLLKWMNSKYASVGLMDKSTGQTLKDDNKNVANLSSLLLALAEKNPTLVDLFIDTLTKPESTGLFCSLFMMRSMFTAISALDEEHALTVLDKCFERFSDELFIKHSPVIQQDHNAQMLLLVSGHSNRDAPMILKGHARSSQYMNAVSKHLSSNSTRIRWIGMVVGTALSQLLDKGDAKMTFGNDIESSPEGNWYLRLTTIEDEPAKTPNLREIFGMNQSKANISGASTTVAIRPKVAKAVSKKAKDKAPPKSKIIEIIGDDDLVPYPKPESDPEDEDEDPTLINRDAPKPPVYIRDLIVGLREFENYDKFRVALETAASLIRRKTGYGKEVTDHSHELAVALMNLNDPFEMDDFAELRHEALVSIILADPANIGEFVIANLFDSDYSLQQRTSILTAVGLSARELAGFKDDAKKDNKKPFPSKQLPDRLHQIYADTPSKLLAISSSLQQSIVQPLALNAADTLTGPNALKVRTFSSRMEVQKRTKKPIPNQLSKIVADKFFFPLTGRWRIAKSSSPHSPFLSGHLLPTYLRTLAIILHAAGPFALAMPQMTSELWDVLLAVRSSSLSNKEYGVLEALLFAFLVMLDVNENKERLATEHARELIETQEWARQVMDVMSSGDEEGEKVRTLAASVIVRCHEVVEKWQRLMLGDMIDW